MAGRDVNINVVAIHKEPEKLVLVQDGIDRLARLEREVGHDKASMPQQLRELKAGGTSTQREAQSARQEVARLQKELGDAKEELEQRRGELGEVKGELAEVRRELEEVKEKEKERMKRKKAIICDLKQDKKNLKKKLGDHAKVRL